MATLYEPHSPERSKGLSLTPFVLVSPKSPGPIPWHFSGPSWALPGGKEMHAVGGGYQSKSRSPLQGDMRPPLEPPKEEHNDYLGKGVLTPRGLRYKLGPRKCGFTIAKLDPQSDRLEPGVPTGNTHASGWRLTGVLMAPQPPLKQMPALRGGPRAFDPGSGGRKQRERSRPGPH